MRTQGTAELILTRTGSRTSDSDAGNNNTRLLSGWSRRHHLPEYDAIGTRSKRGELADAAIGRGRVDRGHETTIPLSASRKELIDNLGRFQEDYRAGVREFMAGNLSIDNLLTRRETLFGQEEQIAELANAVGANVAELCSATGKFFELLGAPTR